MRADAMNPSRPPPIIVDPWELQLFQVELKDWEFTGHHHMHKTLQFHTCQQALHWRALAQAHSELHGLSCLFYLGNVGSGRIDTDILNSIQGHLTRADLGLAIQLNALEKAIKSRPLCPQTYALYSVAREKGIYGDDSAKTLMA